MEDVQLHLDTLRTVLDRHELRDNPHRIWNVDETGIKLGERGGHAKVIASRGVQKVYVRAPAETGHVTFLAAANAAGDYVAPAIILSNATPPHGFMESMAMLHDEEWAVSCEKKGFITEETFFDWMKLFVQELDENCRKDDPTTEHLLVLDQCSAHASLRILQYAEQHNVLLYALLPHTTHYSQPADVGLFGPLKAHYWNAEVELMQERDREYRRRLRDWTAEGNQNQPIFREITVRDVPLLLHKAVQLTFTPENIRSAFKKTSIYPYCREVLLEQVRKRNECPQANAEDNEGNDLDVDDEEPTYQDHWAPNDPEYVVRDPTQRQRHPKLPKVGLQKVKLYLQQQERENQEREAKAKAIEEKRMTRHMRKEEAQREAHRRKAAHTERRESRSSQAALRDSQPENDATHNQSEDDAKRRTRKRKKGMHTTNTTTTHGRGSRPRRRAFVARRQRRSIRIPQRYREE